MFASVDWAYVVLDEGHAIQNPASLTSQAARALCSENRLILSGTPIQNHITDVWALFDFLLPGYLGDQAAFRKGCVRAGHACYTMSLK